MIPETELKAAEELASNAYEFDPSKIIQTHGLRFQHTFNPDFALKLIAELKETRARLDKARRVIASYADESRYRRSITGYSSVDLDGGARAREFLASIGGGK